MGIYLAASRPTSNSVNNCYLTQITSHLNADLAIQICSSTAVTLFEIKKYDGSQNSYLLFFHDFSRFIIGLYPPV